MDWIAGKDEAMGQRGQENDCHIGITHHPSSLAICLHPMCVSVPPKYSVSRYWRMSVTLLQRKSVNIAHPCHCHHKQIPQTLNEQIPQTLNEQILQTLSWADTSAGSLGMRQPALSVSCASDVPAERRPASRKLQKSGFTPRSRTPHIRLAITAKLVN